MIGPVFQFQAQIGTEERCAQLGDQFFLGVCGCSGRCAEARAKAGGRARFLDRNQTDASYRLLKGLQIDIIIDSRHGADAL